MNLEAFSQFDDGAAVWVYGFAAPLTDEQRTLVNEALSAFVDNWRSHGTPVDGAYTLAYDQFAVLAAECPDDISGCSIDSSVRVFKQLKAEHALNAFTNHLVFFRSEGGVRSLTRPDFKGLARDGGIDADSVVFDNTVRTLGALRRGEWERPCRDSWHYDAFVA